MMNSLAPRPLPHSSCLFQVSNVWRTNTDTDSQTRGAPLCWLVHCLASRLVFLSLNPSFLRRGEAALSLPRPAGGGANGDAAAPRRLARHTITTRRVELAPPKEQCVSATHRHILTERDDRQSPSLCVGRRQLGPRDGGTDREVLARGGNLRLSHKHRL